MRITHCWEIVSLTILTAEEYMRQVEWRRYGRWVTLTFDLN